MCRSSSISSLCIGPQLSPEYCQHLIRERLRTDAPCACALVSRHYFGMKQALDTGFNGLRREESEGSGPANSGRFDDADASTGILHRAPARVEDSRSISQYGGNSRYGQPLMPQALEDSDRAGSAAAAGKSPSQRAITTVARQLPITLTAVRPISIS